MPFIYNPEDPKWTAYVLGELDESERTLVEAELAETPEAQQLVAEIRELVGSLETELQREPVFKLAADQREAIAANAKSVVPLKVTDFSRRRKWGLNVAVAATLLIAVGALLLPATQKAREAARRQQGANSITVTGMATKDRQAIVENLPELDLKYDSPPSPLEPRGRIASSSGQGHVAGQNDDVNRYKAVTVVPLFRQSGDIIEFELSGPRTGEQTQTQFGVTPHVILGGTKAKLAENGRTHYGFNPNDPLGNRASDYSTERQKQIMAVTPRIIIQEEEELLGISRANQATSFDAARIERPAFSQSGHYRWRGLSDPLLDYKENEAYDPVTYNAFLPARENPLSTFSIDVDTASYSNVRRFLENNSLPPKAAVRLEEMLNYFHYDYPQPAGDVPFSVTTEVAGCPWQTNHRLVRIGLKGREIAANKRPATNLVFLLDVSGSMSDANKLPLVREAMKLLAEQLTENDRVAIVVYAGASGLVLDSTTGDQQRKIREAIDQLSPGGSTNGASGIQLAYEVAARNFVKDGVNRVLLATDGDFNVGITGRDDLIKLITEQAKSGVFLTTLGFGMGNLKDGTLEQLADKGNGNYAYIDDMQEAKKVFVDQINGTLVTIAKDVKIQVEFNPAEVAEYRLIGYENRVMAAEDFNNDKKDAGEIGAGHTVTALYEIVPVGVAAAEAKMPTVDPLKYQDQAAEPAAKPAGVKNGELLTLKLRYKQPDGDTSKLIEQPLKDSDAPYGKASADYKFAASVALFGMLLQDSPYKGTASYDAVLELAQEGIAKTDKEGLRTEFLELVRKAKELKR